MPLFGHRHARTDTPTRRTTYNRFFRKDRDRSAGGYKAALSNPHTTREGRRHAKRELRYMGRGNETHVPIMTKIKRALGIRSMRRRTTDTTRRRRW